MTELNDYKYPSVKYMVSKATRSRLTLRNLSTVARQVPLSMGFSRQEYWSEQSFPSPEALSEPGIKPRFPALQADSLPSELTGSLGVY